MRSRPGPEGKNDWQGNQRVAEEGEFHKKANRSLVMHGSRRIKLSLVTLTFRTSSNDFGNNSPTTTWLFNRSGNLGALLRSRRHHNLHLESGGRLVDHGKKARRPVRVP